MSLMLQRFMLDTAEFKFYKRLLVEMEAFKSVLSICLLIVCYAKHFIKIYQSQQSLSKISIQLCLRLGKENWPVVLFSPCDIPGEKKSPKQGCVLWLFHLFP